MNKHKNSMLLFEKRVDFDNNLSFNLPQEIYTSAKWSIPSFQNLKEELNKTKSLLNQFDLEEWSRHTKHRDLSSYVVKFIKQKFSPELVTQAWCKFYECLSVFPLIPKNTLTCDKFTSVHLCEAPGAFVTALNHYLVSHNLNLQWTWYANSLNPDYEGNCLEEMIPDDRLLRHTYKNWLFGADFTGNITNYHNHLDIIEKIREKVCLVTADGSIDCSLDPGNQESHVEYLHYCETMTALSILKNGGNFVLKIFTFFENSTICLLYLLNCVFDKVSIFKPVCSKSGNSEVYVICLGFKGVGETFSQSIYPYKLGHFESDKSMFRLDQIDEKFLNQLLKISTFFKERQTETINENILYFRNESQKNNARIHQTKISLANKFIHKYKFKKISADSKIVCFIDISQFLTNDVKKFKFVNGCVKFSRHNLIENINNEILDIKLGKKIDQILSSRFCTKENLSKLSRITLQRVTSPLYQNTEKLIENNTTVLDNTNFTNYDKFQQNFFYKLFTSDKNNFLLVRIPLVTNFLVGLVFLLIFSSEEIYLHRTGFIFVSCCDYNKIRKFLEVVEQSHRSREFPCDVVQIVSPDLFYNNNFFDFIWNYNNVVFSKL